MESIYALSNIENAAAGFIKLTNNVTLFAFHGNLGAGKTTFIQAVCRKLGVKETVSSPTFSIINQHKTGKNKTIFHIDLYRIRDIEEAINAGVEECIYSGDLCFIEWPEKIFPLLPENIVNVFIEPVTDTERKLVYKLPDTFHL
jgi:tRNA threonylcarbamoyladenosine biosynthesis protein TsaE